MFGLCTDAVVVCHCLVIACNASNQSQPQIITHLHEGLKDRLGIKSMILKTWGILKDADDLSPKNTIINDALKGLVETILAQSAPQNYGVDDSEDVRLLLSAPEIREIIESMWKKLSCAEAAMEFWWADKFINDVKSSLDTFWYRDNYRELVRLELKLWKEKKHPVTKDSHFVFIGSGPLPMTAIDVHEQTGAMVTCVDNDPSAVSKSRLLIRRLNLHKVTLASSLMS